jgi:hypothetical protein
MLGSMRRFAFVFSAFALAGISHASLFLVNSPATFYRANSETPYSTIAIDLNANGFYAGQTVVMSRVGAYNQFGGPTPLAFGLSAVFSSTNTLLSSTNLNRVTGAIDAGTDWVSPNTSIGGLSTDISEDFLVDNFAGTGSPVTIVIPTGAQYIFASAVDNFFSDNNNTPEFYLSITEAVPEPMTMAVLGLGAAALLRRRRK